MTQSAERDIHQKLADLQAYLRSLGTVAVAFSGGVDSSLLLKVAHDTLGDGAFAITAETHTMPSEDKPATEEFCRSEGIRQYILTYDELRIPGFAQNPTNRCYLCKTALFEHMAAIANEHGATALAEGSNLDDEGDYRPGLRAVAEQGVKSPLRHAGLHKQDIRDLSRELGLPTWDKPAAACLTRRRTTCAPWAWGRCACASTTTWPASRSRKETLTCWPAPTCGRRSTRGCASWALRT